MKSYMSVWNARKESGEIVVVNRPVSLERLDLEALAQIKKDVCETGSYAQAVLLNVVELDYGMPVNPEEPTDMHGVVLVDMSCRPPESQELVFAEAEAADTRFTELALEHTDWGVDEIRNAIAGGLAIHSGDTLLIRFTSRVL